MTEALVKKRISSKFNPPSAPNKRSKWPSQPERQLKTGDLVWIIEPSSPRGHYPLARVTKLNFGSDAIARPAELKTITGRLVRPVVKRFPVLPLHEVVSPFSCHCLLISNVMENIVPIIPLLV